MFGQRTTTLNLVWNSAEGVRAAAMLSDNDVRAAVGVITARLRSTGDENCHVESVLPQTEAFLYLKLVRVSSPVLNSPYPERRHHATPREVSVLFTSASALSTLARHALAFQLP